MISPVQQNWPNSPQKMKPQEVYGNPLKAQPEVISQKDIIQKFREGTEFSLIYMQYAVPKENIYFTPYYLKIIDFQNVDMSNYFTMTPCGVSQYKNEVIFTRFDDWDAEYTVFTQLKELHFFKHFRLWKAYYVWKKSITFRKYTNARKRLKKFHFCENKVLVVALLAIQWECCDMYMESFADLVEDADINFFYFIQNQIVRFEYIIARMLRFRDVVLEILNNACHRALYDIGFTYDDSNVPPIIKRRGKFIGGMSYTEKADKRKFCERLAAFIKLVDYMKNYMLYRLNKRSYTKISEMFTIHRDFTPDAELLDTPEHDRVLEILPRNTNRCKWALFQLDASIQRNGEVILLPSRDTVNNYMKTITSYWDKTIKDFNHFLTDPNLSKFVQPTIMNRQVDWSAGEPPNLYFMMNQDRTMLNHMENVLGSLNYGFDCVWRYLARFNSLVEEFIKDIEITDQQLTSITDLMIMRQHIITFVTQFAIISKILKYQPLGLFFLSVEMFCNNYLPVPRHLMKVLGDYGIRLGRSVINEFDGLTEKIEEVVEYEYTTPEEKALYVIEVMKAEKEVVHAEERFEYLRELFDMLGEYNMPVLTEDFEDYMGLSMVCSKLRSLIDSRIDSLGLKPEEE